MIYKHATVCASKRTICLIAIVLAIVLSTAAQTEDDTIHFKLRLIIPKPETCIGASKLPVEIVFSNSSEAPISIYTSAIYNLYFIKTITGTKGSKVEDHEITKDVGTGDPARYESPISLQPHSSNVIPLNYDISDPFFREPGTYSMIVRYMKIKTSATPSDAALGNFKSNEVLFRISKCQ